MSETPNYSEKPETEVPTTPVPGETQDAVAPDDSKERASNFITAYGELVKEHGIDFATYPMFVPDGQGSFKIIVQNQPVDIRNQPVKSPFVPQ